MGHPIARISAVVAVLAALLSWGWHLSGGTPEVEACGAAGPFDFDTYEAEDYLAAYTQAIELSAAGKGVTFAYNVGGEPVDVRYQGLLKGPRAARTTQLNTNLAIPPSIMKSIIWIEASWANASSAVPYGGVGPVIRSFDCGYGLGQITSGMGNSTGNASAKQAVIGTHFLFNLAEGARILADKWNSAPKFRPIAGDGDPAMLEDWYYAIWSYNGFAALNHPASDTEHELDWEEYGLNPLRDPLRGEVYHCSDPQAPGYDTFFYGSYTYPEKVYGCMRYPPLRNGARMWNAQTFNMPDLKLEQIANAFKPEHYIKCEDAGFANGCPDMDFPTTLTLEDGKNVEPHKDTTLPVDAALAAGFLGDPFLEYNGPSSMALTVFADGTATKGTVSVANTGTFIGPFRIRTSAPWIVVRHPGQTGRTLDGSIAIGFETDVVTQAPNSTRPRVAQEGYVSELEITLDPLLTPGGTGNVGKVWLEPLLGGGGVFEIDIVASSSAGTPQHRVVAPNVASED
ncbi:MAG: hypothetical protein IT303_14330 [Dehalococcoidia bacterium]|nr:hypothetical protein [Dehalococcoidia bacterium]